MKLLIVSQHFWPEEFRINDICEGLLEKGHEVHVLTGLPNYPKGEFFEGYSWKNRGSNDYKGIKVIRIPIIPRGKDSKIGLILNYISFVISSIFYMRKLKKEKYDRVFVYQTSPITMAIPAVILKKLTKVKIDIYILDLWPQSLFSIVNINSNMIKRISNNICRNIYRSFNKIFITSRGFTQALIDMGIESSDIYYLPQWAEELYRSSDTELMSNCIDKSKFNLTFAGNIGKAQSVDTIIKAANLCREYKDICWNILGDGSESENIKSMVKELGLEENVKLLGRKPMTDMPKYFNNSDALIITLRDDELFKITVPAKLQSYMVSGKPIIGCISGESKVIIEESNCGLACEANDYRDMANIVLKLYNMEEEERNTLGQNGIKYFNNNFDRSKLLDKIDDYLKENVWR